MTTRPLALSGAAFLATVMAALFAPSLLLVAALPLATLLVLRRGKYPALTAVATGCLAAVACCGIFFVSLHHAQALAGQQAVVTGVVLRQGSRQLMLATLPDGSRRLLQPDPPLADATTGQVFACTVEFGLAERSGDGLLFGDGILLPAGIIAAQPLPPDSHPVPLQIAALQLREELCTALLALNPAAATPVTLGLLLSHKADIPYATRQSFSAAGMSHLLATSGLHLSILVWMAGALVRTLGGKRLAQAVAGGAAALLLCLAAGISVTVLRAAIMTLLGLAATLLDRRSDGVTNLTLSAAMLVALCPPIVGSLSFQLSFAAVLGLLLLSQPLLRFFTGLVQRCGHSPGRLCRLLLEGLAVSLAAQLATLPLVGWHFGSVPLLGLVSNLLAIPLAYPILLLGAAAAVALAAGLAPLASGLLVAANCGSTLLLLLAQLVAAVPFGSFATHFPLDFAPLLGLVLLATSLLLPTRRATRHLAAALCAGFCIITAIGSYVVGYSTVTVAASRWDNSLTLLHRGQAVSLAFTTDDNCFCSTRQPLSGSLPNWVRASSPSSLVTEITFGNTKVVKFCAVYDTIIKYGGSIPQQADLLVDCRGNLLSPSGRHLVVRRQSDSFARLPPA